jgi:hypothetical protein
MASRAIREDSPEPLLDGFVALTMQAARGDEREAVLVASTIHHAVLRMNHDPTSFFQKVARSLASLPSIARLLDYVAVPGTLSSARRGLKSMGYTESEDRDGFRYERDW